MGSKSYSKGITWIDDCRIPHNEEIMVAIDYKETKQSENGWNTKNRILEPSNRGRFPANILVCDDMLNDGVVSKSTIFDGKLPNIRGGRFGASDVELTDKRALGGYNDKGSNSRYYNIDKWFDNLLNSCG